MTGARAARAEAVLILDLGSTRVKSTLFTREGAVLARAVAAYPTAAARPAWAEQEPRAWWQATVRATRDALAAVGPPGAGSRGVTVAAVGLTGQMHGLVALDRAGDALGPCLTVQDRRATAEVAAIERELGAERVYALTGARLDAASPAAKLRWLAAHAPDVAARAALFLSPKDYLRFRLTGEAATEPIDAAGTLLYDLRRGTWSAEMAAAARVSVDRLPPVRAGHALGGAVTPVAAAALGVPAGIPVAVGAGDDVECLGAGLLAPGRALEHLGTTGSVLACSPRVVGDPAMRVDCYPHAVPGLYLVGGSTSSAGATLAWAARHLCPSPSPPPSFRDGAPGAATHGLWLGDHLQVTEAEEVVFLPYLAGERSPLWDPYARGTLLGMTLGTTAEQIARAVFAGVAFSLRHILDTLRDLGLRVDDLIASGDTGESAGRAWPALRSTVYGCPLLLPSAESDPTALGALLLTLVALGDHPDVATAAARVIAPPARRVVPQAEAGPAFERRYLLYRAAGQQLSAVSALWAAPPTTTAEALPSGGG